MFEWNSCCQYIINVYFIFREKDVKCISSRLINIRKKLVAKLKDLGSTHDWDHIQNQKGMFSFTGLTKEQVNYYE